MKRIAILASGSGSNAEAIIEHFKDHSSINVSLILSNRQNAYVLERAKMHGISHLSFDKDLLNSENDFIKILSAYNIDYLVLAGFLLLIPAYLTKVFKNKILNIHPALLPEYGGKGMYGHHVHKAVYDNNEKKTGMTIHLVNEKYDEGKILFQDTVSINPDDKPTDIAAKVLKLEHKHYPRIIEEYISNQERLYTSQ